MSKGNFAQLRSYLSRAVNEPASRPNPVGLGGCLLSPVVLATAGFMIGTAVNPAVSFLVTAFVVLPTYAAFIGFLAHRKSKPKTTEQKDASQRRTTMEAIRGELRRKSSQDKTLLTLLEACVQSYNRVETALGQAAWNQAQESHWVTWRAQARKAARAALNEAIDQSAPFLFGTSFPQFEGSLEAQLDTGDLPPDLHPAYGTLYRLAVEMKRLAGEVERQTRELQMSTIANRGLPSEDRIRDVLQDLAHLRQAQDELAADPDVLRGQS